jgi:hypothetical protein
LNLPFNKMWALVGDGIRKVSTPYALLAENTTTWAVDLVSCWLERHPVGTIMGLHTDMEFDLFRRFILAFTLTSGNYPKICRVLPRNL